LPYIIGYLKNTQLVIYAYTRVGHGIGFVKYPCILSATNDFISDMPTIHKFSFIEIITFYKKER